MEQLTGAPVHVFIVLTVVVLGFAAFMTGQALGATWRPAWQVIGYCLLLGLADRFLSYALFDGALLSFTGYLVDTVVITAIALVAFRLTRARRMVAQYPWLYERNGPFAWRERAARGE